MPISICIIDDEPDAQSVMINLMERSSFEFELLGCADSFESGELLLRKVQPDLVFMDINLGGKTGLDLAAIINTSKTSIVFTTAYDRYVLDALRLKASDYLLKPIFLEDFDGMISRYFANKNLIQTSSINELQISITNNDGQHLVKYSDIEYLEAGGAYCLFQLKNKEKLVVSKPLKFYETQLILSNFFFRCHKSYLINIDCISKVMYGEHQIELKSGKIIPLARPQKKSLKAILDL